MPSFNVSIKHAGKTHPITLVTEAPAKKFKEDIYQVTGVPVERMKVMVKGGVLKDDADWSKIAPKDGQTYMVIGAAGELPKPPEKKTLFIEDMEEEDLAQALTLPIGLKNLGNTCYMNATVQALRAVPELQLALEVATSTVQLPNSLRDLYRSMGKSADSFIPSGFLSTLRAAHPQFAEMSRGGKGIMGIMGGGYAQQDAEECYSQILMSLRDVPVPAQLAGVQADGKKFIEQYMSTEVRTELKTDEAPDEPPTFQLERSLKIQCNINISTNYMAQGIDNALKTTLEKQSPSLGRQALYTQTSLLSRLPAYLTVHMVRFAWRADVGPNGGKAKIMRKVKFPQTYDALDIATPELREKLLPASRKLQEFEKERSERRKVRKRTKKVAEPSASGAPDESAPPATPADANAEQPQVMSVDLEPEEVYRKKEIEELVGLVNTDVKNDLGSSWTGVYELIAIITHKGAAADAGHYMGFAKKSAFARPSLPQLKSGTDGDVTMGDATSPGASSSSSGASDPSNPNLTPLPGAEDEDGEEWIKFDDDKVSIFPKEKLATLDGGGEDSSAYVLLYRTKSF